ncbi:unnamed protein product [Bursaphelenchus okinawaensis]|uniref:Dol-P-Glc:Glc(2)Man(9)GlcNAc(2)-PP-Dol alpha-1,2-glucosyltransferase n=1 Tax=Bursaphelenchus okinawaensis TaxID=465554 RepID=A0A811JV05_9BILA|nr:unnamed protein product [Bursaphelenchus okinawaensis]CAG9084496.1 unnamed protein product [Bursaphelenchus okinawaensis]
MSERGLNLKIADFVIASILSSIHYLFTNLYDKHVPDPYMDEVFHIPQVRQYCNGNYRDYDPMLTTPPLMYFLTVATFLCGRERAFNSIMIGLCYLAAAKYGLKQTKQANRWAAVAVCTLPVLFQTSCLYYTDMLSLTLVLAGLSMENKAGSAMVFMLSCLSRQTNIIWAGFYCFCGLIDHLKTVGDDVVVDGKRSSREKRKHDSTLKENSGSTAKKNNSSTVSSKANSSSITSSFDYIKATVYCVVLHWPFAILGAMFVYYLIWNDGSIVLGDKTAHQLHLHLPQLLYFLLFTMLSSSMHVLPRLSQVLRISWYYKPLLVVISVFMALSVHYFSYTHPYLLADNRHYVFYIWNRFMLRYTYFKYAIIPGDILSLVYFFHTLNASSVYFTLGLLLSTAATVIPAHLVEFRYFIIPYAIWRLNVNEKAPKCVCNFVEIVVNVILIVVTTYLFVFHPFEWSHEPGRKQRFMW